MNPADRLPSLNSLRAFEAVTRHLSFSAAAEELNVTKAAVAQQVRQLEEDLGTHLVQRSGRGLILTEAAQVALSDLRGGFDLLFRAARRMRDASGRNRLVVSSTPSFASTWLVGRIGAFKKRNPDMDLLLDATHEMRDLWRDNVDAMIRWGDGHFPDLYAMQIFEEDLFPACAPSLLEGPNAIRTPADLSKHTLLHLEYNPDFESWPTWDTWLKAANVSGVDASGGVYVSQMSMALQAATAGQGVALMTRAIAARELETGRLVKPFDFQLHTPFGYYFVCRKDRMKAPKIVAFRDWLLEAAAADAEMA